MFPAVSVSRFLTGTSAVWLVVASSFSPAVAAAQAPAAARSAAAGRTTPDGGAIPPEYVIGPGDVLAVRFWRRDDVSSDVVVRPDGRISLLLLDDIQAAGFTPEQLRDHIVEKANTLFEDARVTIVVKEVNSRQVFITGLVARPGPYPLRGGLNVLQLIALAGGLLDFANGDRIAIMRKVNDRPTGLLFNYAEVRSLKHLEQNIELMPGDTIVVP
jgi:polysaccharide export outer membrane protein